MRQDEVHCGRRDGINGAGSGSVWYDPTRKRRSGLVPARRRMIRHGKTRFTGGRQNQRGEVSLGGARYVGIRFGAAWRDTARLRSSRQDNARQRYNKERQHTDWQGSKRQRMSGTGRNRRGKASISREGGEVISRLVSMRRDRTGKGLARFVLDRKDWSRQG